MPSEAEYNQIRDNYLNHPEEILKLEQKYMNFLFQVVTNAAQQIADDFDKAIDLLPFWIEYAPLQRGRQPTGESIPWSEVGETAIGANIIREILAADSSVSFPGLPSGADIRFATDDALIHFDVKVTGPNDRADEVVASPNQISGNGLWLNGKVVNSSSDVKGSRSIMPFQPELPPFYIYQDKVLLCLTYFLKGVYVVERIGVQPLDFLELACVPNGLLVFEGPMLINFPGLFIPGKDDKKAKKKRTRVRLGPLKELASWRCKPAWQRA